MTRVGIIGTGSMGGMLARKFTESKAVSPDNICIYNRTPEKMNALVKISGVEICENNRDVAEKSDLIFICVKPGEVKDVLMEINACLGESKTLVSVASDISINKLSEWSGTDVVRVIPSVTSECLSGVSVVAFGEGISQSTRDEVISLLDSISRPFVTTEDNISLLSDLTSSSPAIFASIMQQYAQAAVRNGGLSESDAEFLVREAFIGTAKLLSEKNYDFSSLVSRVSTEGGITAEGIKVVEEGMPEVFDRVFLEMSKKHLKTGEIS
ncbi:MAG: NAD(P)-binding domain-containing protein [Methanomicrobiaceae archaeon]|nr:NAD(P)-binding domain-containing protein [Methanomicrobiaceae archaeon]